MTCEAFVGTNKSRCCLYGSLSLRSDFFSVNFSWKQKLKHKKRAQLNEDKLRRKFQFVKKTLSKTSLRFEKWSLTASTQHCLMNPSIIKKRVRRYRNEIHKTQHFIKVYWITFFTFGPHVRHPSTFLDAKNFLLRLKLNCYLFFLCSFFSTSLGSLSS